MICRDCKDYKEGYCTFLDKKSIGELENPICIGRLSLMASENILDILNEEDDDPADFWKPKET